MAELFVTYYGRSDEGLDARLTEASQGRRTGAGNGVSERRLWFSVPDEQADAAADRVRSFGARCTVRRPN